MTAREKRNNWPFTKYDWYDLDIAGNKIHQTKLIYTIVNKDYNKDYPDSQFKDVVAEQFVVRIEMKNNAESIDF